MKPKKTGISLLVTTILTSALVSACGTSAATSTDTTAAPQQTEQQKPADPAQAQTKTYTDFKNHTVTVPVEPKKIVYTGSDLGDMLTLGVKPVGASLGVIADQVVYPELLTGIEDVGELEGDFEKIASLEPDLILMDAGGTFYEENTYTNLAKIGPAVAYDREPMYERLRRLGDLIGKREQADAWIKQYESKTANVRSQLSTQIKPGATATVLLLLGKEYYIMGNKGFAAMLYETLGFTPAAKVKADLIDKGTQFDTISEEALPDFAGDYLFILSSGNDDSAKTAEALTASPVWKAIPAVKNKHVYVADAKWNFDDPITKERLLDELPKIMQARP